MHFSTQFFRMLLEIAFNSSQSNYNNPVTSMDPADLKLGFNHSESCGVSPTPNNEETTVSTFQHPSYQELDWDYTLLSLYLEYYFFIILKSNYYTNL